VATLVPELTTGVVDGPPEYTLADVTELLVALDGSLFILEYPSLGGAPSLRQYDASGKFIRNVGRDGDGPGEYRTPTGLAQLPDGRILLSDVRGNRINVYSASGEPLETWPLAGRQAAEAISP
jgi:hypothetical protein